MEDASLRITLLSFPPGFFQLTFYIEACLV